MPASSMSSENALSHTKFVCKCTTLPQCLPATEHASHEWCISKYVDCAPSSEHMASNTTACKKELQACLNHSADDRHSHIRSQAGCANMSAQQYVCLAPSMTGQPCPQHTAKQRRHRTSAQTHVPCLRAQMLQLNGQRELWD